METTHAGIAGIILRESTYKEADKILTIFTGARGIITAKARGAIKKGSTLAAGCQIFCFSEFCIHEFGGQIQIDKADPIDQFEGLRNDLVSYSLAAYAAEIALEFGASDVPEDDRLYRLILNTFYAISYRPEIRRDKIKAAFELRVCSIGGYNPDLAFCGVCGNDPVSPRFALESGQIFCAGCCEGCDDELFVLSPQLLLAMRSITECDLKKLLSFRLSASDGAELCEICEKYILLQTEEPKSLSFYKKMLIDEQSERTKQNDDQ